MMIMRYKPYEHVSKRKGFELARKSVWQVVAVALAVAAAEALTVAVACGGHIRFYTHIEKIP
jgi:hypothetical protein